MRLTKLFGCLILMLSITQAYSQKIVQQSLHLGAGPAYYAADGPFNGCGTVINAGWQKTQQSQQLRLSTDLTLGFYNNDCALDLGKANYTTLTARSIYNFDFVQSNQFAVFIGGGGMVNYTFGELLSPGLTAPGNPNYPRDERQIHPGLVANIGLRFLPRSGRLGFEVIPVNVQFSFGAYTELILQGRLFYSLDARKRDQVEKK